MTRRQKMGCAVLALTTILGLVAAEVVVRIVWTPPLGQRDMHFVDPEVGPVPTPGYSDGGLVTINSHGLRDVERDPKKTPGVRRVVVIGDSFTFGAGVPLEEIYPRVLERLLGPGVEVINGGVGGYSQVTMGRWLKKRGMKYQPDVVVVGTYVGNDIMENVETVNFSRAWVVDDVLHEKKRKVRKDSFFRTLRNRSRFYRLLKKLPGWIGNSATGTTQETLFRDHTRQRLGVCATGEAAASWEPGWRLAREALAGIKETAGRAPVVLLVIPDPVQVDPALRKAVVEQFSLEESRYDLDLPQRRLADLARELGVVHVDTLEATRKLAGQGVDLFQSSDIHWNARGHSHAAEALAASEPLKALKR